MSADWYDLANSEWNLCSSDIMKKNFLRYAYDMAVTSAGFAASAADIDLENGAHMKEKFIVLSGIAAMVPTSKIPHYDDDIVRDARNPNVITNY